MTTNEIIRVLKDENADKNTRDAALYEALALIDAAGKAQLLAYAKSLLAEQEAEKSRISH